MEVTLPVRLLAAQDHAAVTRLLDARPAAGAFVADRLDHYGWHRGAGRLYGYSRGGELVAVCLSGANLVPVGTDADAMDAFTGMVRREGRQCSSIVGDAEAVLRLWSGLRPYWGAARAVRERQPLLWADRPAAIAPDPFVRRCRPKDITAVFPAAVAMYTEEVGVSPLHDRSSAAAYRDRLSSLIAAGRSYARIDDGRVVFKAEIAVLTRHTAQIQGVWVAPEFRGQGLAAPCVAAVINDALGRHAPSVSLYVNDFNIPATRAYERCGMRQVGELATVLF
ncbi:N-acetyltransferase GCN5 [Actinorhabdospora filicis]|uniref:N-acetyltransferase GCN5 n=1 Tax=Actinorhabdospora filicis TaxID=1785913 RepID=A0A9W6SHN7_9ACTN|nr:GNAT family N-acetyltransferase [Actinorhabdospora filicis]GLZ75639.1 N-acetyltransferase GCN5 [Actinorhabdospora filicis]